MAADQQEVTTTEILHGDNGYDSNAVRRKIESKGAAPKTRPLEVLLLALYLPPPQRHRTHVRSLEDFRRVATRYDRLAHNFLAALCLAATLCYWL